MVQLMFKDYGIQKKQVLFTIALLIGLITLWHTTGTPIEMMYLVGGLVFSLSLVTGGLGYDEENGVTKFLLTLPVERKDIVVAKYTTGLLSVLLGTVMTFVLVEALNLIVDSIDTPPWTLIFGSVMGNLVAIALILAVYYKFGNKNIRYIYVGFILLAVGGIFLYNLTDIEVAIMQWISDFNQLVLIMVSILITLIIYFISLLWSMRVMARKEL